MPFGLTNAPATFQEMMATIFKYKEGCVWYMYDILMYEGTTAAEHQAFVAKILQQCVKHGLAVNVTKCEFHAHGTLFLEDIVNGRQVQMDPAKLETMSKWPVLSIKEPVHAFLEFTNYYRRFIENYSSTARPLIDLTKDVTFNCVHQQQQAFDELKLDSYPPL